MSKLKLDIDGIEDDFFAGSRILGLMCQLKNYRFCWLLNARLRFDFRLSTDHEVQLKKKGRNYFFQVYGFYETGNELQHYVYQNRFEGEYLLPEFKHFDFLWLIQATIIPDDYFRDLQQNLKEINEIQLIAELTQEKIKHKANLIL
jgi:hypothetical protein